MLDKETRMKLWLDRLDYCHEEINMFRDVNKYQPILWYGKKVMLPVNKHQKVSDANYDKVSNVISNLEKKALWRYLYLLQKDDFKIYKDYDSLKRDILIDKCWIEVLGSGDMYFHGVFDKIEKSFTITFPYGRFTRIKNTNQPKINSRRRPSYTYIDIHK